MSVLFTWARLIASRRSFQSFFFFRSPPFLSLSSRGMHALTEELSSRLFCRSTRSLFYKLVDIVILFLHKQGTKPQVSGKWHGLTDLGGFIPLCMLRIWFANLSFPFVWPFLKTISSQFAGSLSTKLLTKILMPAHLYFIDLFICMLVQWYWLT